MRLRSTTALLLGVATAIALATMPTATAGTSPTIGGGAIGTVTLITGDEITFAHVGSGVQVLGSRPATQRPDVTFLRLTEHGDQYVIPSDAWSSVADGQLDMGLFDITSLVAQGLDDQHTAQLGVIVTGRRGVTPDPAIPATARTTHAVPGLGLRSMTTTKSHATALWASLTGEHHQTARADITPGTKVWLDGLVHASVDPSTAQIGAPTAWHDGDTGQGVTVAVLDSGIDTDHPDLVGKVIASQNFSDSPDVNDHYGHGTAVASVIAGSGAASDGRYQGVAPGVRLIDGKVLDDHGQGDDAGILAGMEWAVQEGARVINMSLGGAPSNGSDVLSDEVNTLSANSGALFVIAAGNAGGKATVGSPATADDALAVASTTTQGTLSTFSSEGPRRGNFGLKPEIAAPGEDIVAARAPGAFPQDAVDTNYVRLSGTSLATPFVTGSAAILAGEHPDWTGQRIKAALMDSATVLPGIDVFGDGAGRVDITRAIDQQVQSLTPDLSLGQLAWPAKPTTASVTYANDSAIPVRLALRLAETTTSGAPTSLFGTDSDSLTVPAHGTASATVRVDAEPDSVGSFEGRLLATAPGVELVTPMAVQVLGRTDPVTVHFVDRSGAPADVDNVFAVLQDDSTGNLIMLVPGADDGTVTATVPDGTYRLLANVQSPSETFSPDTATDVAVDNVVVAGGTTRTVDLRQAQPATVSVDNEPTARPDPISDDYTLTSTVAGSRFALEADTPHEYVLDPTAIPGVTYSYDSAWGRPQDVIRTVGADPIEIDSAVDNSVGWQGDVTGQLVDIGEQTEPSQLGDVAGKIVLIAPDVTPTAAPPDPPTQDQFTALLTALRADGAKLVLSFDFIQDLDILPVLQLFDPNDVQALRDQLSAGTNQVHVVGQPVSPYVYVLHNAVTGALPSGVDWHFGKSGLATVDTTFRAPAGVVGPDDQIFIFADPATGLAGSFDRPFALPQRLVEYYTPGVSWSEFTDIGLDANAGGNSQEQTTPLTYTAGQLSTSGWGSAPFGARIPLVPNSALDGKPLPWVYRQGDQLFTSVPVFNDSDPDHFDAADTDADGADVDTGYTVLYHNGTKVDGSDVPGVAGFTLPAVSGTYRLVVDGTRPTSLSPHVHAEWTFTSQRTDRDVRTAASLLDLGFGLPLDEFDAAAAGTPVTGTVTVTTQQGAAAVRADQLTVAVSYDGGTTWRPATTAQTGGGSWSVTIPPGGAAGGFATLRATASGLGGVGITETITDAYALR